MLVYEAFKFSLLCRDYTLDISYCYSGIVGIYNSYCNSVNKQMTVIKYHGHKAPNYYMSHMDTRLPNKFNASILKTLFILRTQIDVRISRELVTVPQCVEKNVKN